MTNVTTCKLYGAPGYSASERTYRAYLPLKALTSTSVKAGLFVIPKGSTIIAAKAYLMSAPDVALTVNVGTYQIANGDIGTVGDADAFYAASLTTDSQNVGKIIAAAATAKMQLTDTMIVAAAAAELTTAAKEGELYIELTTVQ